MDWHSLFAPQWLRRCFGRFVSEGIATVIAYGVFSYVSQLICHAAAFICDEAFAARSAAFGSRRISEAVAQQQR